MESFNEQLFSQVMTLAQLEMGSAKGTNIVMTDEDEKDGSLNPRWEATKA